MRSGSSDGGGGKARVRGPSCDATALVDADVGLGALGRRTGDKAEVLWSPRRTGDAVQAESRSSATKIDRGAMALL